MANGGYWHTDADWRRAEEPLHQLDPALYRFVEKFGWQYSKNAKDWPERSIVYGNGARWLIQVYLVSQEALTFNVWLCASQDRDGKRFWKQETAIEGKAIPKFKQSFEALLNDCKAKLESWSENDLEFVTDVDSV